MILGFYGPGEVFGELACLEARAHAGTVQAVEECRLLWLGEDAFRQALLSLPHLGYNLAGILARRLHRSNVHRAALRSLDIAGRLSCQLLEFAQDYGQEAGEGIVIPLRLTQSDLAMLIGASRENVSRLLADYKRKGLITTDVRRHLVLRDRSALSKQCKRMSC